ncbi:PhoU domain protein [uncultured archaeon]|nr:PhoU domain protein [uncultured archaeon]
MEVRRVQLTGGSSYILTLPKEWINSLKIKKNTPLGIHMQSDGTLLITPKMMEEQLQRTIEFNTTQIPQERFLLRRLIGAYIAGYTIMKITSTTRIPENVHNVVRLFTQTAIGQEVVEETDTSITLKDLINPIEMPFDRTIKRMHIIVKGMYEDTIRAFQTKDKNLTDDVIKRDTDIDRLHWLIARQYNIILRNVSLAEKMNITNSSASTCFLISRIIERIGDHVVLIAENISMLLKNKINEKIIEYLLAASNQSLNLFNQSINSFFRKDIENSNKTIESVTKLEEMCEKINTRVLDQEGSIALSIGYIVESIQRIGEYSQDISETVINYLIGEEPER